MNVIGLPDGWHAVRTMDLIRDKKLFVQINLLSVALAAILMALGIPVGNLMRATDAPGTMTFLLACAGGCLLYVVLHEAVHGVFVRVFSGKRPQFGFEAGCAWTGRRDAYFDRRSYLIIALSPVVIWGIALLALTILAGRGWFWLVWIVQVINVSGAAGDYAVAAALGKIPGEVLCHDTGTKMTFYQPD